MSETDLLEYYQEMKGKNFVLLFKGTVSQDILVGLKEVMESRFSRCVSHGRTSKKIFAVFIELSQNVLHHSAEKARMESDADIGAGIVIICENDTSYEIRSGNMIDNSRLPEMIKRCDHINSLDRQGLKRLYTERLSKPLDNGRKSPQLGLVDIAIKSGNPIALEAKKLDEQFTFLVIATSIAREDGNG